MVTNETQIRVRYAETDQMGYVYYGNYAQYFEIARVDWFRKQGLTYKSLEENGIMLPVLKLDIDYHKPAKYDDLLTIKTIIKKPLIKFDFHFKVYNEQQELLTTGFTSLVFIDMKRDRPTKAPNSILNLFKK